MTLAKEAGAARRQGIAGALALFLAGTPLVFGSDRAEEGWGRLPKILARIAPPSFPDREFKVTDFGAAGDGKTDARKGILEAIEACARAGGGRVVVPAGDFLCNGPILLRGKVNLRLDAGAVLRFGARPDDYLVGKEAHGGGVPVRWEGTRCYNYAPLVYAAGEKDVAITGTGTLDGQAEAWSTWKGRQKKDQEALREMGRRLVPVEQRVFGRGHYLRPSLIGLYGCRGVWVEGVTVKGSPFWTIHPVECENVVIRGVTVRPGRSNDDGCDPESCRDVLVEGCTFETNDDNIAIKAGRDNDAFPENGGKPCEGVVLRNNVFRRGAPGGISIGSEMSGGVRDVFIEGNRMEKVENAVYLKSNPERGGVVESVWARKVVVASCKTPVRMATDYKGVMSGPRPPEFRDLHFEDLECGSASGPAFSLSGIAGQPIRKVHFRDVRVGSAPKEPEFSHVEDLRMENVTVGGKPVGAVGSGR